MTKDDKSYIKTATGFLCEVKSGKIKSQFKRLLRIRTELKTILSVEETRSKP